MAGSEGGRMMKLIRWLQAAHQNAKIRGEIILTARNLLNDVEGWQPTNISNDAIAVLLMRTGLFHIQAAYQGHLAAQNMIRSKKAPLN
jgi:hypothetical protein